jgi:hypothetical protein
MLVTDKFIVIQIMLYFNFDLSFIEYILRINLSGCYIEMYS